MVSWTVRYPRLYALAQRLASANYRAIRRVIRREFPAPASQRVVDLGCGTGNLADMFPQARYIGVDICPAYTRYARQTTGQSFAVMDVAHLALAGDTFDAAIAVGLDHHLDDETLEEVTRQIRRVCRPGARIVAIDIIPPAPWNIAERLRQRWAEQGRHIRPAGEYHRLLGRHLTVERMYPLRWGFLEYIVIVAKTLPCGNTM